MVLKILLLLLLGECIRTKTAYSTKKKGDVYFPKKQNATNLKEESKSNQFPALTRAINWVHNQSEKDFSWGTSTPQTVLSLALSEGLSTKSSDWKSRLIAKQYELELVLNTWRKRKTNIMSTGRKALHVMTLMALCRNPRDFHSKNFVAELDQADPEIDFEVAFTNLALCLAGKPIRRPRMRALIDIALTPSRNIFLDSFAITILALECVQRQGRHSVKEYLTEGIRTLLEEQESDGSFSSNIHTTALALQALYATNMNSTWNVTKAQEYIMSHQEDDGSFGSLFDTNVVLPILAGKTLLDVAKTDCHDEEFDQMDDNYSYNVGQTTRNHRMQSVPYAMHGKTNHSITKISPKMIHITYIIWIGTEGVNYNLSLIVPENTTFLEIMKMAAEEDERYEFTASKWPAGYYVHTLAGQREKQTGFWFWLLYQMKEAPIRGTKPDNSLVAPVGVMELIPEDGDYLLFWYHQI